MLYGVSERALFRSRSAKATDDRHSVWHDLHKSGDWPAARIGRWFGVHHATVLHALKNFGKARKRSW